MAVMTLLGLHTFHCEHGVSRGVLLFSATYSTHEASPPPCFALVLPFSPLPFWLFVADGTYILGGSCGRGASQEARW